MNRYIILFLYFILIFSFFTGGSNQYDSASLYTGALIDEALIDNENTSYQEDYLSSAPATPSPSPVVLPDIPVPIKVEALPVENKIVEEPATPSNTSEPKVKISEIPDWYMSTESGIKVPILMYHNLLEDCVAGDGLNVSAEAFDDQMQQLKAYDYNTITFSDLYDHYMNGLPLAQNPVIITFDDGYKSNYTIGYPILKKYGLKACIFVITDVIGYGNYLNEEQLREMAFSGVIDVQSHSASHSYYLYSDSKDDISDELSKSRTRIETITGKDVNVFCYTCGKYSQRLVDGLIEQGYIFSVTTKYGIASKKANPFLLPRIRVMGGDSGKNLKAKITRLTGIVTKYIGVPEETSKPELTPEPTIEPDQSIDPGLDTDSNQPTEPEQVQYIDDESEPDQPIDSEPEQITEFNSEESTIPKAEPESTPDNNPENEVNPHGETEP